MWPRQSISSYHVKGYYNYTVGEGLESCAHIKHDVTGSIPAAWEQAGAFPVLQTLKFNNNTLLTGTLPPAWGSQTALHKLQTLFLVSCNFTGKSAVLADSIQLSHSTNLCILLICDAQSSLDAWLVSVAL